MRNAWGRPDDDEDQQRRDPLHVYKQVSLCVLRYMICSRRGLQRLDIQLASHKTPRSSLTQTICDLSSRMLMDV